MKVLLLLNRLEKLHQKRHLKIKDIFHKASSEVVKIALEENTQHHYHWAKQRVETKINIGKRNNQSFVSIPHQFID